MENKLVIAVLAGTMRQKRESVKAARYVAEIGRSLPGVEVIFVDPADFTFPDDGDDTEGKDPHYTEITSRADAFLIVTPEYNHSFPGHLKRMLDSEWDNYAHKPVALIGASSGNWGGVRVVEALVPVVRTMGLVPVSISAYFPHVQDMFVDDQGTIMPELAERTNKQVASVYNELLWMARTLKWGRENVK